MTKNRTTKACEIIDYAIINNFSVKKASKLLGYGKNYVSEVKRAHESQIENNISSYDKLLFLDSYNKYLDSPKHIIPSEQLQSIMSTKEKNAKQMQPIDTFVINTKEKNKEKIVVEEKDNEKNIEWTSSSYSSDHIKTLDELLKESEVDTRIWKVKSHIVNKWDVTLINKNSGNPETIQNFQVKAILEKNIEESRNILASEVFKKMLLNYEAPILYVPTSDVTDNLENNLLEISLFDLHIGKLAWHGETGENYDVKIASRRFMEAINKLINQASSFKFNRVLFPIGNDFFNSDNLNNTTTHGTPQEEDLRWKNSFSVGVKLLVDAIILLKQTGVPVDVLVIPGNHDFERSYYMGSYLDAWFRDDAQVNINNGASPRKYYKFGKVLLGFTHGSEEKETSLPMLMATDIDSKPVWSETVFHEWHLGHQHRKKGFKYTVNRDTMFNEEFGVIVRYLSSLTGTEEWHHRKGFLGSAKAGEAFIWNSSYGMKAHLNVNIDN